MSVPRSGVSYSTIAEEGLAAVWAGYEPVEFLDLEGEIQSYVVALYRLHNQVEAVVANEQAKEMKRKSTKKPRSGKRR